MDRTYPAGIGYILLYILLFGKFTRTPFYKSTYDQEAEDKQSWIEEKAYKASLIPDKLRYRQELIELLNSGNLDDIDLELLEEDSDATSEKKGVAGVFSGIKNAFGRK